MAKNIFEEISKLKSIIFIILVLLSFQIYAATDPVTWQLSNALQNPVFVGRTYTMTYTFTSQLPFKMTKPLVVQEAATPSNEFSYTDNCSGKKLAPNASCTVGITFIPATNGNKSVQLKLSGYDNNQMLVPALTTVAQGGSSVQSVYGSVVQPLVSTSYIGEAGNYSFSFTNASGAGLSSVSVDVTQTAGTPSFTTTCGSTLGAGNTCTVSGSYTPTSDSPNVQSVTATLHYNSGSSATISTSTNISASTGLVASFVGTDYLPAVMVNGTTRTLWFLFTNAGPGAINVSTGGSPVVATVGGSHATLTPVFNHCLSVSNLQPGASCDIQYMFDATSIGNVTVEGTANCSGASCTGPTSSISTSTDILSSLGTSRTLQFVNNCGFSVWFSLNGGELGSSPSCTTDSDCPSGGVGTACSSLTNKCYWKNQAPSSNAPGGTTLYELPTGQSNTVTIPLTAADPAIQWSGNISASLGCNGSTSCTQADCANNGGSTACKAGQGFTPPATQAEITMNIATNDSYDVEVINGFHIPVSMAPTPPVNIDNYTCGTPGQYAASNGFGACDWTTAVPPSPSGGYYYVTSGGGSCNISSSTGNCTAPGQAGQICGLDASFNQVCGNFLGYWTADQVCSEPNLPAAVSTYFQCTTPLAGLSSTVSFPSGSTLYDLMACPVPKGDVQSTFNSCYLTYSGVPSNNQIPCCGCKDWWTVSGIGANSNTQSCTQAGQASPQTDPVWNQYIQNGVAWLKKACPSAYVYPFDDKTSGFSCTNTLPGESNSVGYTITFCAGNSGLPPGKNEGRT